MIGTFSLLGLEDCCFDAESLDGDLLAEKLLELLEHPDGDRFARAVAEARASLVRFEESLRTLRL